MATKVHLVKAMVFPVVMYGCERPTQTVCEMINLDSILKIRDITLLTKVHLVKGMVFPVVKYGYESWTINKAGHQKS